jgi:hypothetical protein
MQSRTKYVAFSPGDENKNPAGSSKTPSKIDRPVVDWWNQYVSSPKYRERLAGFYAYPDYVQRQRASVLNDLSYRENTGPASRYYSNGNEVVMSDSQVKALNTTRPEIASHEIGHSVNANANNKAARLSSEEEKFILKRNKAASTDLQKRYENLSKERNKSISELMGGELHDINPSENISDVQSLRFLLKKRNIYDAGKQDVTPDIIRKASFDPVIRKSFIWKRLQQSFGEKELTEIMNKVASASSVKKQNTV